jgi:fructose-1,6-bisphosphatase/inositol monophosphatase family enzyme
MNNNFDEITNNEYGKFALELYSLFAPLALKLPQLRNDPTLMKAIIKATGKSGITDVVTEADKYMQQKIKEEVAKIHPDWQFWGEEGEDNKSEYQTGKSFMVITDPIEGTNNFRARLDDQWGSVIALVDIKTKEPVVGIVAHPTKRLFYFGIKDGGAYILAYNESNELSLTNKMSPAQIYGYEDFTYNASPHFNPELINVVDEFVAMGQIQPHKKDATDLEKSRKTIVIADEGGNKVVFIDPESGALEAVRNRGTIYFKTSNEMAAVFVILNELGGCVTDGQGNPWTLGINTLIAARNKKDYIYLKSLYDNAVSKAASENKSQ